ncbi:hypothetical protein A2V61_02945 [Candidatus Woesebacteria bacterium RBG_19FT_COMBO_47_8]|nr:MAG: hypothetical protein A2V61_02945 [Candidatus Woesebacteria bacterium RBG_19FT_COMBO_47_8]
MQGIIFESGNKDKEEAKETPKQDQAEVVKETAPEVKGSLSAEALTLLKYYQSTIKEETSQQWEPKVKVGETLSGVAQVYERLRYAVDYKKEHLLRRNAIERILKRQLRTVERNPREIADNLIKELIWARYLRNDYLPVSRTEAAAGIIAKYLKFFSLIPSRYHDRKEGAWWRDWLISVASCELEEAIDPSLISIDALSLSTLSWFKKRYQWLGDGLDDTQKDIQTTIAVYRGLFRTDDARTAYHLLKNMYPQWSNIRAEDLDGNTPKIFDLFATIRADLNPAIQTRLYRFVQRQISAFQILKEVIEQDVENAARVFANPQVLEEAVYDVCEEKYGEISDRVARGIIRSIIYIFVTKIFFAIVIEIPYEYYFLGGISYVPLLTTVLIPILFVFLVALTIKKPNEANTQRILEKISDFVYVSGRKEKTKFSLTAANRGGIMYKAFAFVYSVLFLLIFGAISYLLQKIGFNFVGGVIFFIFLSLVLLFAYRVKFTASELNVTEPKESLLSHLMTNLSLPLLDVGVWLSDKFSRFNFLIVFLDILIEAPLKNIIGVADEWTSFVKERKEEVVEIPVER